jgi:hypothetical protein
MALAWPNNTNLLKGFIKAVWLILDLFMARFYNITY